MINNIARIVVLSYGWRRAAIAFGAGLVSALAMAPFDAWPVLFLTLPPLVWLIDGAGAGRFGGVASAALSGWLFGFGYLLVGLYWIGNAFLVDADAFGWLLPFIVSGLPAFLALFFALAFALARAIWPHDATRILALAASVTACEWLRGNLLTGFPWNALGNAFGGQLALAQSASLIGLWGLTFLAVAIFASPAALADDAARRRWLAPVLGVGLLAAMAVFGTLRLAQQPTQFVDNVTLRLMQPNLQQDVKFNYSAKQAVMQKYLSMSERSTGSQGNGLNGVTVLIWPESAFPFFLTREGDAMAQIARLLPQGTVLLTGAIRAPDDAPRGVPTRAYNSIYAIDHDGTILSIYDKLYLVPGGEFLPLQSLLEKIGLRQLTKLRGGFLAGDRRRVITLPNAPRVLPLICYEAIFSGAIVPSGERPGWIVNLTNDGWFGNSTGPYQHLAQARMRAIEDGLPIVRSANTGISAVIDPLGRIVNALPLGIEGVMDARLPDAAQSTFFSRAGNWPAMCLVIIATLVAMIRRRAGSSLRNAVR